METPNLLVMRPGRSSEHPSPYFVKASRPVRLSELVPFIMKSAYLGGFSGQSAALHARNPTVLNLQCQRVEARPLAAAAPRRRRAQLPH